MSDNFPIEMISFTVPLEPKSLQFSGKRLTVRGGQPRFFKTKDAQLYQQLIATLARPHRPKTALSGPLILAVEFVMPRPQRLGKKNPNRQPCWVRPDTDNLIKPLKDSLSAFWVDDSQICVELVKKTYAAIGEDSHIEVCIGKIEL